MKLVALILLLAGLAPAWAQQDTAMQVNVGFNDYYKVGEWVPVTIFLENPGGKDIAGELVVEIAESTGDSVYSKPVILPPNSKKKYTLYVLIRQYKAILKGELRDEGGRLVAEEEKALRPLYPRDTLILVLDEEKAGLNFLSGTGSAYGTGEIKVVYPEVALLPGSWKGYGGVDLVVIGDFSPRELTREQQEALEAWVRLGGSLVVSAGMNYLNYRGTFVEELLPVELQGTKVLGSLEALEEYGALELLDSQGVVVSDSTVKNGKTMLSQGDTPLIVEGKASNGRVVFLAFDHSRYPFKGWDGNPTLWEEILASLRDYAPYESQQKLGDLLWNTLRRLPVVATPSFKFIGLFLLAYILVLGPLNYFVLKRMDKREYAWISIPVIVLLFSLGAYAAGYSIKGGELLLKEVSILEAGEGSGFARVESHFALFSPKRTSYEVVIKDGNAAVSEYSPRGVQEKNIINIVERGEDVLLRFSMNMWSMRTFSVESHADLEATVAAELKIVDSTVQGEIENHLPFALSDAYAVFGGNYQELGELGRGEVAEINLTFGGGATRRIHIAAPASLPAPPSPVNVPPRLHSSGGLKAIIYELMQKKASPNEVLVLGTVNTSFLDIELNKKPKKEASTFLMIRVPIHEGEQRVFRILEGMSGRRIIEYHANGTFEVQPGGGIRMQKGYFVAQFKLPIEAENVTADSLLVKFNAFPDGPASLITLQIYDWEEGEWDTIRTISAPAPPGDVMISQPGRYVKFPGGLVKLKVIADSVYVNKLDISFEGHRGD